MQEKIMRKYSSSGNGKRDQWIKCRCTGEEKRLIRQSINKKGFENERDYLLYLVQNDDAITAEAKRLLDNQKIRFMRISTCINKIDSGVEVEESKNKLVEEVRCVCQECK